MVISFMVVHIHPCLALVVDARVLQLLMPVFFSLGRSLWLFKTSGVWYSYP
jgi:hypothetical protein